MFSPLKVAKDYTALGRNASSKIILLFWISIGLAKRFVWVFHKMVQKNSNELFGQPNIFQKVISRKTIWSKLAVQVSSVTQSCLTLWNPMDSSMPGLPVHHQLLEFTQTHVHWVGDAIQPSHHLSSPFLPAFNLSQHQGLFKWVSSSHQGAKVLDFQLQHQSFQWTLRTDFF